VIQEATKKAINRPQAMRPLRAAVDEAYSKAAEASRMGKPVAWSMSDYWEAPPIFKAMDVVTIYPENFGAMCAAVGAAPSFLERSEAEGFPAHLCGYARNCIGYTAKMKELGEIPPGAPAGGMAKPTMLLASGGLCDSRFKWFQALGRYWDAPIWTLEIPHPGVKEHFQKGTYEHNIKFMVAGLREFVTFLENLLGKKMDWDKLDEFVDEMIEVSRVWHEINELRKARPGPMNSRDFWSCMNVSLFSLGDYKVALDLYRHLYDEIKYRVDNKIGAIAEEKYRLVFAELPPWHSLGFFNQLAERGWNFVVESWSYHPPKPQDLSKVSDPLERIARHCLQFFTGYHRGAMENEEWWGYAAYPYFEYARDYQCDGAVLHPLLTCRPNTGALMAIQDRLMKKLKIPSLVLEGDIVDLKLFNPVDALQKAEAFEETMEHYQKVRKEEGLAW